MPLRLPGCCHEGSPRGSDAADHRAEPAEPAEGQPLVVGRHPPGQRPQRSDRYFDSPPSVISFAPSLLNVGFEVAAEVCSLVALKLFTSLCSSVVTADSHPALPPPPPPRPPVSHPNPLLSLLPISLPLSAPPLFSPSLPAIVALPSWSRFCRVGFALSTRPCWTGAHAECLQSLPQTRTDLSM